MFGAGLPECAAGFRVDLLPLKEVAVGLASGTGSDQGASSFGEFSLKRADLSFGTLDAVFQDALLVGHPLSAVCGEEADPDEADPERQEIDLGGVPGWQ